MRLLCLKSDEDGLFWPVQGYFSEGERLTDFLGHEVVKYHHTLEHIVMGLLDSDFRIDALVEARPSAEALERNSEMKTELERPIMLIIRCRKV